jgi:hypothetical protein
MKCLDVVGGPAATHDTAELNQWACDGPTSTNQQFELRQVAVVGTDVYYNIIAKHSGKCLDVVNVSLDDMARVQQYRCLGASQTNQHFRFVRDYVNVQRYQIIARHSGSCLDVIGGFDATHDGIRIQQYRCLGTGQFNQYFFPIGFPGLPSLDW